MKRINLNDKEECWKSIEYEIREQDWSKVAIFADRLSELGDESNADCLRWIAKSNSESPYSIELYNRNDYWMALVGGMSYGYDVEFELPELINQLQLARLYYQRFYE